MKSFLICQDTGNHSPYSDLRAQTRPSGDIEFVNVGQGAGADRPSNTIVGVLDKKHVRELIDFLKEAL